MWPSCCKYNDVTHRLDLCVIKQAQCKVLIKWPRKNNQNKLWDQQISFQHKAKLSKLFNFYST